MNIYIGMPYEEVLKSLGEGDDVSVQDMKNGYSWIRGRFELCGERVKIAICFKDGLLWMIKIYPHYNLEVKREPFEIHPLDLKYCEQWLLKNKVELPDCATVIEDKRTPEVAILIR
ncbi:MAG: hypothetical protein MJ094_01130 [Saccharofermentans sp.]|nr:hypothetical protein [Saccharofermentans sp.]